MGRKANPAAVAFESAPALPNERRTAPVVPIKIAEFIHESKVRSLAKYVLGSTFWRVDTGFFPIPKKPLKQLDIWYLSPFTPFLISSFEFSFSNLTFSLGISFSNLTFFLI